MLIASLGDAKSSLGDSLQLSDSLLVTASLGDAKSLLGDADRLAG
jgi:hypothetical protein